MKIFSRLIAVFLVWIILTQSVWAAFPDVEYSWYKSSINRLADAGIIRGYDDGNFGPEALVTRAEVLKMVMNMAKIEVSQTTLTQCFPDVDATAWYSSYICTANSLGIAKGFDSGKFWPNDTVTTLEALTFGLRAFKLVPEKSGTHWYDAYQKLADGFNIIKTQEYTLSTKISRGKTAELIERIAAYNTSKTKLDFKSTWCLTPGSLMKQNLIKINGINREYNLAVPSSYSKTQTYRLIVALHGRTNSNDMVQGYMGLDSSRRGTQTDSIVAYPAGVSVKGGFSWSEYSNVQFFDAMIDQIASNYCIDRNQINIVGHSLGGWFANKLSCLRGDVIRGVVVVGWPSYSGECTWPVATLLMHKTDDTLVPYSWGKAAEVFHKSVNQCSDKSHNVTVAWYAGRQWDGCTPGNPVLWFEKYTTFQNDPHSWPKSGGAAALEFFRGL